MKLLEVFKLADVLDFGEAVPTQIEGCEVRELAERGDIVDVSSTEVQDA